MTTKRQAFLLTQVNGVDVGEDYDFEGRFVVHVDETELVRRPRSKQGFIREPNDGEPLDFGE